VAELYMEYNSDILSSCRISVGTHLVVEIVLVSHTSKSYTRNSRGARGSHPPLSSSTIMHIFLNSRGHNYCRSLQETWLHYHAYIFFITKTGSDHKK